MLVHKNFFVKGLNVKIFLTEARSAEARDFLAYIQESVQRKFFVTAADECVFVRGNFFVTVADEGDFIRENFSLTVTRHCD